MSGVVLCKWSGTRFETATEEQRHRYDEANSLFDADTSRGSVHGWAMHHVGFSPGDHFEVRVGNKFVITAKNQATHLQEYPRITVDLMRPDQLPESLYNVDGTARNI